MRMVASFAARQRHDGACLLLCRCFGRANVAIKTTLTEARDRCEWWRWSRRGNGTAERACYVAVALGELAWQSRPC
jgi:hypothetical protein